MEPPADLLLDEPSDCPVLRLTKMLRYVGSDYEKRASSGL